MIIIVIIIIIIIIIHYLNSSINFALIVILLVDNSIVNTIKIYNTIAFIVNLSIINIDYYCYHKSILIHL